jgi:hypothetical protein
LLDEFLLWLELDSPLCFVDVVPFGGLPPSGRLTWDAPAAGKGRIRRPSNAPGGREAEGLEREIGCGGSFVVRNIDSGSRPEATETEAAATPMPSAPA